jgi:hypothetical protein
MESSTPPNDDRLLTEDGGGPVLILSTAHHPHGHLALLFPGGRVELITGVNEEEGLMVAEELEFFEC